jgi:hypothetical protein
MDELAVPAGLHQRILRSTIGTAKASAVKASWITEVGEWLRGLRLPVAMPQLAPVAMILAFAFLIFGDTVSADGTLTGVYQRSFELAGQTYQQSSAVWKGKSAVQTIDEEVVTDPTFVNGEEQK